MAYIDAVATNAGFQVTPPTVDNDSVDGILIGNFGKRPRIEFQAKATSRDILRPDGLHFPLPLKNYNDLRIEAINPRILIVLLMPEDINKWLQQTDQELLLRHCAYWKSLKDEQATPNESSVTVQLPLSNIFSSAQLLEMMENTERTGAL